jgi:hypothetical protein
MNPGEAALGCAFQPEVRARRLLVPERQLAPALLAALTDRQLMLIAEEPPVAKEEMGRFTQVYTYCPPDRVGSMEVVPGEGKDGLDLLRLTLVNGNARHAIDSKVGAGKASEFARLSRSVDEAVRKQQAVGLRGRPEPPMEEEYFSNQSHRRH